MRKRMLALGLALGTSLGAIPTAAALAATTVQPPLASSSNPRTTNAVSGAAIVQTAMRYLGYPYTATGDSPSTGFSCIGFVSFVYRTNGIALPGDLGGALAFAPQVAFSDLMPGDILYFQNTVWSGLSHAGIYIGGGRFVHAEWYNRGVVVSSFNNDPVDGNYWIGKYLGANRPWRGAALSAVPYPPGPPGGQAGSNPSTSTQTQVASGPTATVTVSGGLNVRSRPSKQGNVVQVVGQGTTVVIIGKKHGWYKVQLPDGTVGWVVAYGISAGQTSGPTTSTVSGANGAGGGSGTPASAQMSRQDDPRSARWSSRVGTISRRRWEGGTLSDQP